jgi:hypothetical protein
MKRVYLYPYAGPGGRNYFKQIGTTEDVILNDIKLEEGLRMKFYCEDADDDGSEDDLIFEGTVHFDPQREQWFAIVDEETYRHSSDLRGASE